MWEPTRPLPQVGGRGRIRHFGGELEAVVICEVRDGGREVVVRTAGGELAAFTLRPATAAFVLAGERDGPRLLLG